MKINKIIQGDALEELKKLPDESVNMCVTSPPYWRLRNYEIEGQLGLELTSQESRSLVLTCLRALFLGSFFRR
jgi:DNA modification methylase